METHRLHSDQAWAQLAQKLASPEERGNAWSLHVSSPCPKNLSLNMSLPYNAIILVIYQEDASSCWDDMLWRSMLSKAQVRTIGVIQTRYNSQGEPTHHQKIVMKSDVRFDRLERNGLMLPLLPTLVARSARLVSVTIKGDNNGPCDMYDLSRVFAAAHIDFQE